MKESFDIRIARRASSLLGWLSLKSDTGSLLMGDDGPVTRMEFLVVNAIFVLLFVGACCVSGALWLTLLCLGFSVPLVRYLILGGHARTKDEE